MSDMYLIEFSVKRRGHYEEDFTEIGFGSSGGWDDIGSAAYEAESIIQNRLWETSPGMPDPKEVP
jgi:hypothetical protein